MKVLLMTGSHPRHLYLALVLKQAGSLDGLIIEERGGLIPSPPSGLSEQDHQNYLRHFTGRARAEKDYFGENDSKGFPDVPVSKVTHSELNSDQVRAWIKQLDCQVVLTYGVHKIENRLLEDFPKYAWNIHGGLSPWYKGCITLFWPFYFLQPNWAGMTVHYLSARLDGGDIIHHSVPELAYGDGIHDVAAKAVIQVAEDLVKILAQLKGGKDFPGQKQRSNGKLFVGKDWRPQHLRLIYNTFNDDLVDHYLDGRLGQSEPPLIKAIK